jgi:regulator of sirC expression with transglutaminase-like and TPR domain
VHPSEARDQFQRQLAESEIDLVRAAGWLAAEDDPACDVDAFVAEIDALGRRATLPPLATGSARLMRLNELMFRELGFDGTRCDFGDPASSHLPAVLTRRTGLPIALAVLWVTIGRRAGLDCAGVGFPGHFLAKATLGGHDVFVDPFHGGALLTESDLRDRFARSSRGAPFETSLLEPAPTRAILARMLRNLKNLHVRRGDLPRAFAAVDRLLLATPDAWDDLRDRGLLALQLGGKDVARRDLERYLATRGHAPDAPFIRQQLDKLAARPPLLN